MYSSAIIILKGLRARYRRDCSTTKSTVPDDSCDDNEHKENSKIASLIAQKAALEAKEASDAQAQAGAEASLEVDSFFVKKYIILKYFSFI